MAKYVVTVLHPLPHPVLEPAGAQGLVLLPAPQLPVEEETLVRDEAEVLALGQEHQPVVVLPFWSVEGKSIVTEPGYRSIVCNICQG